MKEEKIALVKAIDSGDTDLGKYLPDVGLNELIGSIPSPNSPPKYIITRRFLPRPR